MRGAKNNKQRAYSFGKLAEGVAAFLLRLKGYQILAQRFRAPGGEVDIIAKRGRALVFVEVKARGQLADAAFSILPRQQARIEAAARAFLARHPDYFNWNMRFDVILVAPMRFPSHIMDAWRILE